MTTTHSALSGSSDANPSPFHPSPFHKGELAIQDHMGVRAEMDPWARQVIHDSLPDQHREFYAQLPFVVVAARDEQGEPWVTLLAGEPGFASSADPGELAIAAAPAIGDPLHGALHVGSDIGVLGIEPQTRRRNRVNGRVSERDAGGFLLQVEQSFGNCPQHITERIAHRAEGAVRGIAAERRQSLSHSARSLIATADTFFIATGYRGRGESVTYGMDASHRGGPPGFVRVLGDRMLAFEDYAENNHFNTIGNIGLDARTSLLFVDFERGALLHLRGRSEVLWQGKRRVVRFELDEAIERQNALPLRWTQPQENLRELRVAAIVQESADVRSFILTPVDGRPLEPFAAGQYLPVSVSIRGNEHPVLRTYSLSGSPRDAHYRISVKRESHGLVSRHLHDEIKVSDVLRAGAPSGTFVLDTRSSRPAVLLSAGVGLTPMVAMLHALAGSEKPTIFVHGTRDGANHSLQREVRDVVNAHTNTSLHVAYSRPGEGDVAGRDFDSTGRLRVDLLEKLLPGLDADFYLCGPSAFLAGLQQGLREAGVPASQIHSESFGAAGQ